MCSRILIVMALLAALADASGRGRAARAQNSPSWRPVLELATHESAEETEVLPPPQPVAEARRPLSLADLEQIALRNHPALAALEARVDAAHGRWLQAGLKPNPVAGYHSTEVGNRGTAGAQGAFVQQRFITGGKLHLDQAIAAQQIQEAQFRLRAQELRVLSDVRVRFYETLVAQRRVELARELARIGDEFASAAERLLQARVGAENDLLQAQIRADEAHLLLENAQNEHVEAWRRLASVAAAPSMPMTPLEGEPEAHLPEFDWDRCRAMVLNDHPQLQAALARAERARIAIERAHNENIPDVDAFVSLRHANVSSDDIANVQIGIPLPIRNRNQGNIQAAQAKWIAASNDVQRTELQLQDRLAVAWRRYANARQQVERYRGRIVPRAERSLELVEEGYAKRQVEYLTLLTAQQTYVQVNLSYLNALRQLWNASFVIKGQLLTGSLEATVNP